MLDRRSHWTAPPPPWNDEASRSARRNAVGVDRARIRASTVPVCRALALALLIATVACDDTAARGPADSPTPTSLAPDSEDTPIKPTHRPPAPTASSLAPASPGPSTRPPSGTQAEVRPVDDADRADGKIEQLAIEVLASFPHDPTAFTQGLLFHNGELYESTGLWGRSSLRRTLPDSGVAVARHDLERQYFGEGLALVGERLVQLTWKSGVALVYDRESLVMVDQWGYNGEGWGLAYDGERFIMSDGSSRLTYRSPEDFRWLETVEVTSEGRPLAKINELEYVDGKLYGNVWGEDRIVRLDPRTGIVDASIKVENLLTPSESRMVDVLNGIAYDSESETFWLTGKLWPRMFQVRFVPKP